jgi:hypothetical protein
MISKAWRDALVKGGLSLGSIRFGSNLINYGLPLPQNGIPLRVTNFLEGRDCALKKYILPWRLLKTPKEMYIS